MAPLSQAIQVVHRDQETRDGVETYVGDTVDPEWTIGTTPNGGFILSLILEACIQRQSSSTHPDPIHVTAHFIYASQSNAPFKIRVRSLKQGKGFTNLLADFIQNDITKVTSHLIFGILSPPGQQDSSNSSPKLTLAPPSPYARRVPLVHHPSTAPRGIVDRRYSFRNHLTITREPEIASRNLPNSPARTNSHTVGGGGVDYGIWCGFKDPKEKITTVSLPLFADISVNTPLLVPKELRGGMYMSWFPTMTMTIEFKFPIPPPLDNVHSNRVVGIFSSGRFVNDPQGRHDLYTEIWTAPCNIGEGEEIEGWRDKQVCLAVSTQMALASSTGGAATKKQSARM